MKTLGKLLFALALLMATTVSLSASAKVFRNPFIMFELPSDWNCQSNGKKGVCTSTPGPAVKEALIIFAAKEAGPADTLNDFLTHLQAPKNNAGAKVVYTKQRTIDGQIWVDSMHFGSELGPYFTRYLATIKNNVSVVVTFSAEKDVYAKYSADFMRAIESLKVIATKDALRSHDMGLQEVTGLDPGISPFDSNATDMPKPKAKSHLGLWLLLLAAMLAGAGGYLYLGKQPKKKKTKKKV